MTTDPVITSVANRRVKDAVSLQRRKGRDATGLYLLEGPNAVEEALAEGVADTVYATADHVVDYDDAAGAVEVVEVAEHVLEKIATTRTPQGVVAVARQRRTPLQDVVGRGVLVVVHEVADPGNAGTIIRTADALGVTAVVLTSGAVDPFNPKAVRASTGSITRQAVVTGVSIDTVIAACRQHGQRVLALDASSSRSVEEAGLFEPPVALLFGSEAHGLPDDAAPDASVSIPRFGRAESLNLAVAVGVATYLAVRADRGDPNAV